METDPYTPLSETEDAHASDLDIEVNDETIKLQAEAQEYKNKYLSSLAELENMRKRLQKERIEMTKFAVGEVIADFLEPMDHLEKALGFTDQMSKETQNWAMGFTMILAQFKNILNEHGITAFGLKGDHFDPHMHEAVDTVETDADHDGTILEVFAKGYRSSERTIRPAKVKVAKANTQKDPTS